MTLQDRPTTVISVEPYLLLLERGGSMESGREVSDANGQAVGVLRAKIANGAFVVEVLDSEARRIRRRLETIKRSMVCLTEREIVLSLENVDNQLYIHPTDYLSMAVDDWQSEKLGWAVQNQRSGDHGRYVRLHVTHPRALGVSLVSAGGLCLYVGNGKFAPVNATIPPAVGPAPIPAVQSPSMAIQNTTGQISDPDHVQVRQVCLVEYQGEKPPEWDYDHRFPENDHEWMEYIARLEGQMFPRGRGHTPEEAFDRLRGQPGINIQNFVLVGAPTSFAPAMPAAPASRLTRARRQVEI